MPASITCQTHYTYNLKTSYTYILRMQTGSLKTAVTASFLKLPLQHTEKIVKLAIFSLTNFGLLKNAEVFY